VTRHMCLTGSARFSPATVASVWESTDTVKVNCILLSKRQYAVGIGDEIRILTRLSHLYIAKESILYPARTPQDLSTRSLSTGS
jgi:hypothetical protein